MRVHRAYTYVCGAALGYLGDTVLGDPRRGHPVAGFGRVAAAAERAMWRDHRGAGAAYAALCAGGAAAAAAAARHAARSLDAHLAEAASPDAAPGESALLRAHLPAAGRRRAHAPGGDRPEAAYGPSSAALLACVAWASLGGSGLGRAARRVGAALETGDVEGARRLLPTLCGRDPQALDAQGIARAVVESVAENTSDAVVGALVWGALAGAPGMAGFRAVNTLDAMVGHRSPRHLRFGWAAARADDAAGWPGARLTALLAAVAGPDTRGAVRAWRQDAAGHPSPNAGPVEAAFAGALGVRLGGTLAYGGRVEHRPVLNASGRAVRTADVERAVRLSRRVCGAALLVTVGAGAGLRTVLAGVAKRNGSRPAGRRGKGMR
jgi:adenosylcobinamide-phosphate synthase